MHLFTILAFAILFWHAEQPGQWVLLPEDDVSWTLAIVLGQITVIVLVALLISVRGRWLLARRPDTPQVAQMFYHRSSLVLRCAALIGFAVSVFLTPWPTWFAFGEWFVPLQIAGHLITLSPLLVTIILTWVVSYPLERILRGPISGGSVFVEDKTKPEWRLRTFLDFQLRHHILVVAVPMTIILFAADVTRGYQEPLQRWSGWVWTPDVLLALVAGGVFVVAPLMLRHIWRTRPLEPGPVRSALEELSRRVGVRFREILVWHSDGMMINAAVMGLLPRVRFVLLSDALLATMNVRQVEAVFGHETGHIRLRHIQHFLVFAVAGWLGAAGLMELIARSVPWTESGYSRAAVTTEGIAIGAMVIAWGLAFGWISRRFEREADLFGARCVTPGAADCVLPCSVHRDTSGQDTTANDGADLNPKKPQSGRVCATGADVFTSALDRVAVLNGIPHEERSWRHSSIGSRIRFLTSLAGDPNRAARFERLLRRLKRMILGVVVIGSVAFVYYWLAVPEPAMLRLQGAVR